MKRLLLILLLTSTCDAAFDRDIFGGDQWQHRSILDLLVPSGTNDNALLHWSSSKWSASDPNNLGWNDSNDILTASGLNLTMPSQYYLFGGRGSALTIQGQTSTYGADIELYSKDGDGDEDIMIGLIVTGTPTDVDPYEGFYIGYHRTLEAYILASNSYTTGDAVTNHPIQIYVDEYYNQLVLSDDGNVSMSGNLGVTGSLSTAGDTITIATTKTPSGPSDTGTTGQMAWDSDYEYRCVATNTWKRVALSTWGIPAEDVVYAAEDVIYAAEQVVYP